MSPSGVRAAFEARGEILTVPAEKGDIRNLTQTTSAAERDPAWSPDGKTIAYFSDESGEYMLHLRDARGTGEARRRSPWAMRRTSTSTRSGRPTARRSPMPTTEQALVRRT